MNRLALELQRLYGMDAPDAPDTAAGVDGPVLVDAAGQVRALVLGVSAPAPWEALAAVWQGVQADLALPAPAIAVCGDEGYQLWFSLAQAVPAARARQFLDGLRRRYLGELPTRQVAIWPAMAASSPPVLHALPVPRPQTGGERWSAFVAQDLAPVFADEPWLDLPPNGDGQAQLLARLTSIRATDFDAALQALVQEHAATEPATSDGPPVPAAFERDPTRFLLNVMNDASAPLALRIDAAKALLTARPAAPRA